MTVAFIVDKVINSSARLYWYKEIEEGRKKLTSPRALVLKEEMQDLFNFIRKISSVSEIDMMSCTNPEWLKEPYKEARRCLHKKLSCQCNDTQERA